MTEQDYELLSAYLDDMLTLSERETLEARLTAEPELRRELNALRQTVTLMRQLPVMKAPRNYTLTAEMVADAKPMGRISPVHKPMTGGRVMRFPLISALSSAAAFVLIALGIVLLAGTGAEDAGDMVSNSAPEVALFSSETLETTEEFDVAFANTGELSTAERLTASARTANDLMDTDDEAFAEEEAEMDTFAESAESSVILASEMPPAVMQTVPASIAGVVPVPTLTMDNRSMNTSDAVTGGLGGAADGVEAQDSVESEAVPIPQSSTLQSFEYAAPASDESQAMMQIQLPTETVGFSLTATQLADDVLKQATETLIAGTEVALMEEIAPEDTALGGANIGDTTAFEREPADESNSDQTAGILLIVAGVLAIGVSVITFWQSRRG